MFFAHVQATVAGIELLLPALLRIDAGSSAAFTDAAGNAWAADFAFVGERASLFLDAACAPAAGCMQLGSRVCHCAEQTLPAALSGAPRRAFCNAFLSEPHVPEPGASL